MMRWLWRLIPHEHRWETTDMEEVIRHLHNEVRLPCVRCGRTR